MKFRMKKITALMAAAVLGASTFGGVSVMAAESTEAMAVPADQAGMVVDDDAVAAEGDAIPSDFIQGTFKPYETTVQAQDSYEYPFSFHSDFYEQHENNGTVQGHCNAG